DGCGYLAGSVSTGQNLSRNHERLISRGRPGVAVCIEPGGAGPVHVPGRSRSSAGSIRGSAKSVVVASQASIVAPFVLGGLLAWGLYPRLGGGAPRLPFVLFLGVAMGITAFPVLARILADRKLMHTRVGVFAISCAAFDDLTAWCLLAVISLIARPEASQT